MRQPLSPNFSSNDSSNASIIPCSPQPRFYLTRPNPSFTLNGPQRHTNGVSRAIMRLLHNPPHVRRELILPASIPLWPITGNDRQDGRPNRFILKREVIHAFRDRRLGYFGNYRFLSVCFFCFSRLANVANVANVFEFIKFIVC